MNNPTDGTDPATLKSALRSTLWVLEHPEVNALRFAGNPRGLASRIRGLLGESAPTICQEHCEGRPECGSYGICAERLHMVDSRFFIDHGVVHDRVTGKHLYGNDGAEPGAAEFLLALLRELEQRATAPNMRNACPTHGIERTPGCVTCRQMIDAEVAAEVASGVAGTRRPLTGDRIDELWEALEHKAPIYLARAVEREHGIGAGGVGMLGEPHACRFFNGKCIDCGRSYGDRSPGAGVLPGQQQEVGRG